MPNKLKREWDLQAWDRKFGQTYAHVNGKWIYIKEFDSYNDDYYYFCVKDSELVKGAEEPDYHQLPSGLYTSKDKNKKDLIVSVQRKIAKSWKIGIHPEIYNISLYYEHLPKVSFAAKEITDALIILNNLKDPINFKQVSLKTPYIINKYWMIYNKKPYFGELSFNKTDTNLPKVVKDAIKIYDASVN